ncbi:exopolysaccharide biosynthesis protein [Rhizobium rhizogenes]|uniref:Exopolysaccharide biosynthesis protein n=1 Tax=Rhizobium rhizogenes (strain K84 / ATCC BAA-868) TaxID=311403 RepID=B9JHH4_RHIR8|nr:exopolysaccharide biosynthesis protein [Rhizobium rhizogenes]ACM29367.1 exopolysaccharide biosynthesis protein [Rhizobium rhizogenes K84]NTI44312.1 exopolysaccharide biosynthesis protein [Rhizobium rhizogenes]OCJ09763.1 exopolysaccharide biosynthesis protein [Agrobacterium sp. B131/95]
MTEQAAGAAPQEEMASVRLKELAKLAQSQGGVSVREVLSGLGRTSMAFTILFLALPALTPIPGPFGMVFGSALALVAVQIAMGRQTLWLPAFLNRRRLSSTVVDLVVRYSVPIIARVEAIIRPGRLVMFTGRMMQWLLAFPIFVLAIAIALPIPFGNFLPVLALTVISIALMARDGLVTLVGLILCLLAFAATVGLVHVAVTNLSGIGS